MDNHSVFGSWWCSNVGSHIICSFSYLDWRMPKVEYYITTVFYTGGDVWIGEPRL